MSKNKLSHVDEHGKASMVDIGHKPVVNRQARAEGLIILEKETIRLIEKNEMKKGDVLGTAEIAGIQAAKCTGNLIPLCHPLLLTKVDVKATLVTHGVQVVSQVKNTGQTGVEMEALTAVSVALLTIYDMCKAIDKKMTIGPISLTEKSKSPVNA